MALILTLEGLDSPILTPITPPKQNPQAQVVAAYIVSFQRRYQTRPPISGKMLGRIKCLLKYIPVDQLCSLIQAYLQMNDDWFLKRCHDFDTFEAQLTRVKVALDSGCQHPAVRDSVSQKSWEELAEDCEKLKRVSRG